MPNRILVVDDESIVTEVIERYLRLEKYDVMVAEDGAQALRIAKDWLPNLVILDLILPRVDGLEVCRQLRKHASVPIIMLTARGGEDDRIAGLELGADDYIVKPFSPRELVARVKSVLRRSADSLARKAGYPLNCGNLVIDSEARQVTVDGQFVGLTTKEFDLLYLLASHPSQVFTRKQLVNEVWGNDYGVEYSTITVHVRRLRAKIEIDPMKPPLIKTLWGMGYKFEAGAHEIKR